MDLTREVLETLHKCYLPKLSRNIEECENHNEFSSWKTNLKNNCPKLLVLLNNINLLDNELATKVLPSLLILHYEFQSEGPWKCREQDEYLLKINHQFELLYGITLHNLFQSKNSFPSQSIFDKTVELLHKKLTYHEFKKYPALLESYFMLSKYLKQYEIILKPSSILPASLLMIDDYINENKIKGLKCCSLILACLTADHFKDGNYYEVIYSVLKKNITEKDVNLIELVLECILNLIRTLPNKVKMVTIEDLLITLLEQLYTETNLYKKKHFFVFLKCLIDLHGVNSGKRKLFLSVICDNLDICTNKAVADILLADVIECLENWLKYCWCIWRLHSHIKLLSVLMKLLYIYCGNDIITIKIQNILITLIKISSTEEQKEINGSLTKSIQDTRGLNECFVNKLEAIKKEVGV